VEELHSNAVSVSVSSGLSRRNLLTNGVDDRLLEFDEIGRPARNSSSNSEVAMQSSLPGEATIVRTILVLTLLLCSIAPASYGQAGEPDARIQMLEDSISKLLTARNQVMSDLEAATIANPTSLLGVQVTPRSDRVFIGAQLDKPGRIEVEVRNAAGAVVASRRTEEFRTVHPPMALSGLSPGTAYRATVVALANNGGSAQLPSVRWTGATGQAGYNPALSFTTPNSPAVPSVELVAPPTVTHNSITLNPRSSHPSLFRISIYEQNAAGTWREPAVFTQGSPFSVSELGVPTASSAEFRPEQTITISGLRPATVYYYEVQAMNRDGMIGTPVTPRQVFTTSSVPIPFGFTGPLELGIDPTQGLVVTWKAATMASAGQLQIQLPGGARPVTLSAGANLADGGTTLSANISNLALLQAALSPTGQAPVIIASMTNGTGEQREVQVRFQLLMPRTEAEVNAVPGLSNEQRAGLHRMIQAASNPRRKLHWEDVATAALKIIPLALAPL
jgi:hypothetical protein